MNNCLFCRIIAKELPAILISETDRIIVFQSLENHPLIVSKNHVSDIYILDDETGGQIMKEAIRIAKALKKSLGCEGVNLIQSNEAAAGQDIFHFHLHVKPRWKDDGVKITWDLGSIDDEQRKQTAEKIRYALGVK